MNKIKYDEPINIFVSTNEEFTHKAFLYGKTKSSKPKYYDLKDGDTVYIKEVNPERIDEEILEDDYANEEFPQDSDMMDESIEKALK